MLHKIRKAMEARDTKYQLGGLVEIDDSFLGAPKPGSKRGRGTEKKIILIALSLDAKGRPKYLKLEPVSDLRGETIIDFAKRNLKPEAKISTDLYSSYKVLSDKYQHDPKKFNLLDNPDHLKWLHTVISNLKRFIKGTFHGLGTKHISAYLAEFSYRFNRRHFGNELFNRLLNSCVNTKATTYAELV